jgi:hypothetical protein
LPLVIGIALPSSGAWRATSSVRFYRSSGAILIGLGIRLAFERRE